MKVGDKFTIDGKEYEAVKGLCGDCALFIGFCNTNENEKIFNCTDEENSKNDIIAKEVK